MATKYPVTNIRKIRKFGYQDGKGGSGIACVDTNCPNRKREEYSSRGDTCYRYVCYNVISCLISSNIRVRVVSAGPSQPSVFRWQIDSSGKIHTIDQIIGNCDVATKERLNAYIDGYREGFKVYRVEQKKKESEKRAKVAAEEAIIRSRTSQGWTSL